MRRLFAIGHLDPVGGRVTAGGAPPGSGPSGWRPGRATRPRASERRKLLRLADELQNARDKYRARMGHRDWLVLLDAREVLERLADGMDVVEVAEDLEIVDAKTRGGP